MVIDEKKESGIGSLQARENCQGHRPILSAANKAFSVAEFLG